MNAPRRIRTVVVSVPADSQHSLDRSSSTKPRFRPSDLLPWSDPYIASLVKGLQEEIRAEQGSSRLAGEAESPFSESIAFDPQEQFGFSIDPESVLIG